MAWIVLSEGELTGAEAFLDNITPIIAAAIKTTAQGIRIAKITPVDNLFFSFL